MNQERMVYEEQEIDLLDMCFMLLKKWKMIVVIALVGAIVGGIFGMMKKPKLVEPTQAEMTEYQKQYDAYKANLVVYMQQEAVYQGNMERCQAAVDYYQQLVDRTNEELQNNPLIADETGFYKATVNLYIKCDLSDWDIMPENANWDPADIVIRNYINYMNAELDWEKIAKTMDISKDYIASFIKYSEDSLGNNIIITAYGESKKSAEKLLGLIVNDVEKQCETVSEVVGKHEVMTLTQFTTSVEDGDSYIESYRNGKTEALINYRNSLNQSIKDEASITDLVEPEEPVKPEAYYEGKGMKDILKYAIVGLIFGGFIICGIYVAIYVLDGKVHTESEFESFGLQILGKKNDIKRVAMNIANFANEDEKILITGTVATEKIEEIAKGIQDELAEYEFAISGSLSENVDTLNHVKEADKIIVVEELNKSKRSEILKHLNYYRSMGKKIIGVAEVE